MNRKILCGVIFLFFLGYQTVFALPISFALVLVSPIIGTISGVVFIASMFIFSLGHMSLKKKIYGVLGLFLIFSITIGWYYLFLKKESVMMYEKIIQENNVGNVYNKTYMFSDIGELKISLEELESNRDSYFLTDIREPIEYEYMMSLDTSVINKRAPELLRNFSDFSQNISQKIILLCVDGNRSRIIAKLLNQQGYEVYYLDGGIKKLGLNPRYTTPRDIYDCKKGENITEIYIGDNRDDLVSVPFLFLTEEEINSILYDLEKKKILSLDSMIGVSTDGLGPNRDLGRYTAVDHLQKRGYNKICYIR